jgi:hypothetical protein
MCVNNIHTQVRHHRGVEEKEEEEPPANKEMHHDG